MYNDYNILRGNDLIGIYLNTNKSEAENISSSLIGHLKERKIKYAFIGSDFTFVPDLIVVIGGDGTVLGVAEKAARNNVPVLALNAGSVGFLSSFEGTETEQCADLIADGKYCIEERPLLECCLDNKLFYALNDVSVQRMLNCCAVGCTLSIELSIDGEFVDGFRADGIVIATPTGSTAYSLSAGGAVLAPKINALIATPICAHTLRSKPIVFSDDALSEVNVCSGDAGVYCDGKFVGVLSAQSKISIKKSGYSLKIIKGKKSFYQTLFNKLTAWSGK